MPENKTLAGFNASVDGSEYEEYTFTGCKADIDAQEQLELKKHNLTHTQAQQARQSKLKLEQVLPQRKHAARARFGH